MRTAVATDDEGPDPDLVRKVLQLRALAASTPYVPERESALAKVAELMFEHRLTEADLEPPSPPPAFWVMTPWGPRRVDEETYRRVEEQERAREAAAMVRAAATRAVAFGFVSVNVAGVWGSTTTASSPHSVRFDFTTP